MIIEHLGTLWLQKLCSYVLWPLAFIIGIPSEDCSVVGGLLGLRAITSPAVAYVHLSRYIDNKKQLVSYERLYNDTRLVQDDMFLPQWNTTLRGGILKVRILNVRMLQLYILHVILS